MQPTQPSAEERGSLLRRILSTGSFRRSKRLSDFLTFVVEADMHGRADQISEQSIGQRLYGKQPGYNAAEENVVRVDARRLREALGAYFREEGSGDPLRVDIPKGHYVPIYHAAPGLDRRHPGSPSGPPSQEIASHAPRRQFVSALLGLSVGLAAGPALWRFATGSSPALDTERSSRNPLLAALNDADRDTLLILPDTMFWIAQRLTGKKYSLADYLTISPLWNQQAPELWRAAEWEEMRDVLNGQYTSMTTVNFVSKFMQIQGPSATRTRVRFARNVDTRDLQQSNVVLIGGERVNPWVELFKDGFQFTHEYDPDLKRSAFRNHYPHEDEPVVYRPGDPSNQGAEVFAHIVARANPNGGGQVLIIEGSFVEGREAGQAFVLDGEQMARLTDLSGPAGGPFRFEVLLRSAAFKGGASTPKIAALRLPAALAR